MNMFTMPLNNKRRLARDDGPSSAAGPSSRRSMVRVDDERAKSLLRERDAKVAALEKEVVGLRNRLATLSKEAGAVGGGARRRGGKELTPYGNTVRVSYSKCSAKRKQVSCFRPFPRTFFGFFRNNISHSLPLRPRPLFPQLMSERSRMGRNASISTQAVLNSLPDSSSSSNSVDELVGRINDMFRRCVCVVWKSLFCASIQFSPRLLQSR